MTKDLPTGEPWKLKSCLATGSEASLPRQGTPWSVGLLLRGRSSEARHRVLEPFGVAPPGWVPAFQGGTRCSDHDDYAIVEQYLHFGN